MSKIKHTYAILLCLMCTAGAMAQVDVTAIYLKNAGFDTNYDYPIDATGNVEQEMLNVAGWTNDYSVAYTIVGTYQIGTKKKFNGASVPATNVDGTSEGGVLALSTGWNESIKLYQDVTLPKGEYSLVTAYYNGSSATSATSLVGWVPSTGTGVMSEMKSFPTNQWVVDTLSLKLIIRKTGKVQVGMTGVDGGSANSAKLSIDYVKILSYSWDGSIFEDAVEKAVRLYDDGTDNGAAALKVAIDAANVVLNDSTATPDEQVAATAAINEAMDVFNTLQNAYKTLRKAIDKAVSTLGDDAGIGAAALQAAIAKAEAVYANVEATSEELLAETTAINDALSVYKKVLSARNAFLKTLDEVIVLAEGTTGTGLADLQTAIAEAQQTANNMDATADELAAATATLKEAAFVYQLANGTGTAPEVITHGYVARGSTMALGRSTVNGVSTSNLLEQGFCWSTSPEPTVLDNRSTKYQTQNGRIYLMENLEPSTIYYVRAYAISKSYAVGYGEVVKVITLPAGKVIWSYDNGADAAANARINAAVEDAVYYMNTWTSINGLHANVHYGSGTPTADCSYGGWMRVGPNASYQRTGTILHELGHAIGVGTHSVWNGGSTPMREGSGSGYWTGERATAAVRFFDNSTTSKLNGDGTHMWPYGVNGAHEDTGSAMLYVSNAAIYQALGEDGLPPTGGFCTPAYVFEQEDTIKYYIKSEHQNYGLYTSYLVQNEKGHLVWQTLTASEALANENAAWYITFNPVNCYYQLRNAATGAYMTYAATGANGIRTAAKAEAGANENFHLMRSRIDVKIGSGNDAMNVRGYWIIHPENKSNPATLVAASNGAVSTASFNLGNNVAIQRWLLLSGDEVTQFEGAYLGTDIEEPVMDEAPKCVHVYNITGVCVRENATTLEGLPAGIYIVGGRKVLIP
ncbi:MAG: hypothetical protein IKV15_07230 [Bacteroidaceae bacterium]|nr:hypothetical protein [Bacteroidaceae bacterium]